MAKRSDDERVVLDYSPSSGAIGSEQKNFEIDCPTHDYGKSNKQTGFDPREAPDNSIITRFGEWYQKWEWLDKLNDGVGDHERKEDARVADIRRDVMMLGAQFPLDETIINRVINILLKVHENRDGGLSFGSTNPIEVTELAALSIAARQYIDVDDFEDIDPSKEPRHDAAFDGPTFSSLCGSWPPSSKDVDVSDVRSVRAKLSNFITNE